MDKHLEPRDGERLSFTATFDRQSWKQTGYRGIGKRTVLLVDLHLAATGQRTKDRAWFNLTKGFERLRMEPGDRIAFDARVSSYATRRGGRGYGLTHPTKVQKVDEPGSDR